MRQTTCGEIHKIKINNSDVIESFLKNEKKSFNHYLENRNCIYSNKIVIDNPSVNYLNEYSTKDIFTSEYQLKSILRSEYDKCEKIYPFGGEVFLNLFFDKKILNSKKIHIFKKDTCEDFFNTSKDRNAINLINVISKKSSPNRSISIESSKIDSIYLKKENDIFFNIEYDTSFLGSNNSVEAKNYRFAIIDGFIESVSEIHHMLHFAASSKEPYVIFCFGMSEEVKNVIIQNNSRKITQIIPISMKIDESTINILNDIAIVHNSDVISSFKGQTISQEMRKELEIGDYIFLNRKGFKIKPLNSEENIKSHISFLKNKIEKASPDTNTSLIKDRIKNLKNKSLDIYVPEDIKNDISFNRELDYLLRMLYSSKKGYYRLSLENRNIMIPKTIFDNIVKKVNNTKDIIYNIGKIITIEEKQWESNQK
jgi:hypothetical protein